MEFIIADCGIISREIECRDLSCRPHSPGP